MCSDAGRQRLCVPPISSGHPPRHPPTSSGVIPYTHRCAAILMTGGRSGAPRRSGCSGRGSNESPCCELAVARLAPANLAAAAAARHRLRPTPPSVPRSAPQRRAAPPRRLDDALGRKSTRRGPPAALLLLHPGSHIIASASPLPQGRSEALRPPCSGGASAARDIKLWRNLAPGAPAAGRWERGASARGRKPLAGSGGGGGDGGRAAHRTAPARRPPPPPPRPPRTPLRPGGARRTPAAPRR